MNDDNTPLGILHRARELIATYGLARDSFTEPSPKVAGASCYCSGGALAVAAGLAAEDFCIGDWAELDDATHALLDAAGVSYVEHPKALFDWSDANTEADVLATFDRAIAGLSAANG